MKPLRTILLFLLLGAVINVVVAWGCGLWCPLSTLEWIPDDRSGFRERVDRLPDNLFVTIGLRRGIGLHTVRFQWHIPAESHGLWLIEVGWPVKCLTGQIDLEGKTTGCIIAPSWLWPRNIPGFDRMLPLTPLWPMLLVNILLYALLSWLLLVAPFRIRAYSRTRRVLCPNCAYDLRGMDHQACPECGIAIRKVNPA